MKFVEVIITFTRAFTVILNDSEFLFCFFNKNTDTKANYSLFLVKPGAFLNT